MTEEQLDQLRKEAKVGEQANTAWMSYVKKYTEGKQKELFAEFLDTSLADCHMVKFKQQALDQLVSSILLTIETGKLAEKQLEEDRMTENAIEQEIQDKGLNAPRLTPSKIDSVITDEAYYVFPDTTVTVCCLTLLNGFNTVGTSAAASPSNFDVEIGRKIARENARNKIWELEATY